MILKTPTCKYESCNTCQILIFSGYVKVRESFVYPSSSLDQYHSNLLILRWFYLDMKILAWYILDPIGFETL